MQTSYAPQGGALSGMLADIRDSLKVSRKLPATAVAQVQDITITAVDSTVYTVTINGVPVTFTSGVSTTTTLIRDGLIAAIAASAFAAALETGSANGATKVRMTAVTAGLAVTVTVGANLAIASITQPAGTTAAFGRGLTRTAFDGARMPQLGDTAALFDGVALQKYSVDPGDLVSPATDPPGYPPGAVMDVVKQGAVWVDVYSTNTPAFGDSVYWRLDTGMFSNASDGGNTANLTSQFGERVAWDGAVSGGRALLFLNL